MCLNSGGGWQRTIFFKIFLEEGENDREYYGNCQFLEFFILHSE